MPIVRTVLLAVAAFPLMLGVSQVAPANTDDEETKLVPAGLVGGSPLTPPSHEDAGKVPENQVTYSHPDGWDLDDIVSGPGTLPYSMMVFDVARKGEDLVVGVVIANDDSVVTVADEVRATVADLASGNAIGARSIPRNAESTTIAPSDEWKVVAVTTAAYARVPEAMSSDATSIGSTQKATNGGATKGFPTARAGKCGKIWKPNRVLMAAGYSSTSKSRYAKVEFKWTNSTRMSNMKACPAVTLEPDFVLNNYDRKAYLGKMRTWSTNMPSRYVYWDTGVLDSKNEPVYTVGIKDATQLKVNTNYYTFIRTANGNASTDKAKVIMQRGKKTVPGCTSLWCIQSTDSVTGRFPPSSGTWVTIPGTKTWTS